MRWIFPLESWFSYWCLKTIWIHSTAAFVSILLHCITQTANLSIAAHLGISAVSLTLTTTTPCNDANPNVCALSLPVILANYTYTYDSDLPNLLAIPYPLLHLISQERNRSAAPHFLKNIILTPHTHVLLDVGKGRHRCGYGCGCLLMSQAPGQMSLFCAAFLSYHLIYSSSCSF